MKSFLHLLSFSSICILLAGQYGYLPIATYWYDIYAAFSCITTIIISIIGASIVYTLQDPSHIGELGIKGKRSVLNQSYHPIVYVNSVLGWIVLINANFTLVAILSILVTILWLETVKYLKASIRKSL